MPYYAPPNHQPSMVYLKYGTKEQCNEWFGLFEAHLSSSNDDRFGMYSFVGGANDYKDEVGPAPKSQQASLIRQMESGGKDDWRLLKGIKYLSTRIERVTSPIQPLSSMASASPLSTRMLSLSPSSETLNSKRNSGDMDVTKNIQELDIKSPERPEKHVTPGLGEDSLSSPEKRHTRPKIASIERGKSGSNSHVGSPDSDTNVFALNLGLELDSIYGSVAHRGDTPVQELRTPDTLVDTSCELISQSKRTRVEENKQNHVENTQRDQVS
ncbi:hypothetical protein AX774_g2171 [Zancudomyces culisetae]|uniref:Uncharacterized protein n=1 Tax=Zancudomyces culisetae TaxID=1213189 RepID=A0A1R1PTL9_ZANCU|nr:hypothetical protein AX774_g2171 [Zancudomyces culisetae]|eukprot:OMH84308.1 hypothetical protein AX774_g2171 [Zancudomyces culisetae]